MVSCFYCCYCLGSFGGCWLSRLLAGESEVSNAVIDMQPFITISVQSSLAVVFFTSVGVSVGVAGAVDVLADSVCFFTSVGVSVGVAGAVDVLADSVCFFTSVGVSVGVAGAVDILADSVFSRVLVLVFVLLVLWIF